MNTELSSEANRYTVSCRHCAQTVFRESRHIAETQITMIERHLLICRPLVCVEETRDLFAHFRVTEREM